MAFVGRERELAQLAAALQRAADGGPARVALTGPVGIGKSRLIDEFGRRLAEVPGIVVCRGRAYEPTAGVAYHPLAEALRAPLGALRDPRLAEVVGGAAHDLTHLLPGLTQRLEAVGLDIEPPELDAPDQRRSRVAEGVLGILDRLASDGVVLLVLEDVHWADAATRAFIGALLRISRPTRLCVVVTYGNDELDRHHPLRGLARDLEDHALVTRIEVPPLTVEELHALVGGTEEGPPSRSFIAALMEGSRGNPLVAEQLVAAHRAVDGIRLADAFDDIIDARLDALGRSATRAIQVLAAARRPLRREQLRRISLPDGHLSEAGLRSAVESGFVRAADDGLGIAHVLYGEAVERMAVVQDRRAMHLALARLPGLSAAETAWHLERGGDGHGARAGHLHAADASAELDPGETTLGHMERAIEIARSGPMDPPGGSEDDEAWLLARAGQAAAAAGSFRRAAAYVQQALDQRAGRRVAARASGPERPPRGLLIEVGELYEALGRYRWESGDVAAGTRAMEDALEVIPVDAHRERAHALATLAQHLMIEGRYGESAPIAREARDVASAAGDAALAEYGHATCTLGVDVSYLGEVASGLELLREATTVARRAGRLDDLMRAYANRTTLLDLDSRREEALAVVTEGIREASAAGLGGTYGAFLRGNAADILFMLGRWRESEVECRAGMEWRPAGVAWFSPTLYLGLVLVESRADEEAARLVGQTLLQLESVPAGQWTALVQRSAVSLALWRGDVAEALTVAAREWERSLETDDGALVALAASTTTEAAAAVSATARERRDWVTLATAGELAQRVVPEAERRVARSELSPSLGAYREARLHLGMARAHLARVRGRGDPAAWAELAAQWAAIPVPYQAAKARWWEATACLLKRDRRQQAGAALLAAWETARALPAIPLQRALADLATRGRIPLPDRESVSGLQSADRREPDDRRAVLGSPERRDGVARPTRPLVPVGPGRPEPTDIGRAIGEHLLAPPEPMSTSRFGLSPRESEVLFVLAEGRTNREIAERLFISERTVGVHVRRILAKLGASGRVEAAGMAIRLGLVPGTSPVGELRAIGRGP